MRGLYALSLPFTKPVLYLGPKPATAHDLHYHLKHLPTDTQQDFPLVGLSPLCSSQLMDRESIKLKLKLLFFRYTEYGHLLYGSNMRADHGHSEQ